MNRFLLKNKNAFTLLEIAVVAAIIGIIVVMLLPSMKASFNKTYKDDACNNLKSIHSAQQSYKENTGAYYASDPSGICALKKNDSASINSTLKVGIVPTGETAYYCCYGDSDCTANLQASGEIRYSTCTGTPCTPQCSGKCGGGDGCGNTCLNNCSGGNVCNPNTNTCCTPNCSGRCSGGDSCGSTCPDNCVAPATCGGAGIQNECGWQNCGGTCGGSTPYCCENPGQCVDLEHDTNNCGQCGTVCKNPTPDCGGTVYGCQNLNDTTNCGSFGNNCVDPYRDCCGVGVGCVNLQSDPKNCGTCRNDCTTQDCGGTPCTTCSSGACSP